MYILEMIAKESTLEKYRLNYLLHRICNQVAQLQYSLGQKTSHLIRDKTSMIHELLTGFFPAPTLHPYSLNGGHLPAR